MGPPYRPEDNSPAGVMQFASRRGCVTAYRICFVLLVLLSSLMAHAADTVSPAGGARKFYRIAPGSLDAALNKLGVEAGVLISFTSELTAGVQTAGVEGNLTASEALNALLAGTGLEVTGDAASGFNVQRAKAGRPAPTKSEPAKPETNTVAPTAARVPLPDLNAPEVVVVGIRPTDAGPLPGLLITKDQIPGNIQSASKAELKESRAINLGDYMNSQMQGVSISNYSGNPFQMDVNYRGFTASPEIGTPQGLSVFFDGIRVNEPFGDIVNWDLIPLNAIERFDLFPGSNPLFGLNTLGGAISLRTKSGFSSPGADLTVSGGSWGRKEVQFSGGGNNGTIAGFGALHYFDEDGWRDNSPSKIGQFFGRGDWRGQYGELTASVLLADNNLIGNGLIPYELYQDRPESVFTSPDQTKNRLIQFALSGALDVTEKMNITAQVYRRRSDRSGVNGDIYEGFDDFSSESDLSRTGFHKINPALPWCQVANVNGSGVYNGPGGNPVLNGTPGTDCSLGAYDSQIPRNGGSGNVAGGTPAQGLGPGVVDGTPIGLISKTSLGQVTDGGALQANWNLDRHKFMVGASTDRSRASYELVQRLGLIDASHNVYEDPANIDPVYRAAQVDITGNQFDGTERTNSLYFNETWSALSNLHFTFASRYNVTNVKSNIQSRSAEGSARLDQIRNRNVVGSQIAVICPTTDPSSCPAEPAPVPFDFNGNATRKTPTNDNFTYTSLNPQLGVNWLPVQTLNLYGNVSRGARVPSVVELGCAFDSTQVLIDPNNPQFGTTARSLAGPTCTLPTTLSGDPFLPQIRATAGEVGARGKMWGNWEWNASLYRTDLSNDIYYVGVADGRSYFDTIGKTRRQGLELGLNGSLGRFDVKLGYAYVDATFQSTFYTVSPHNSSADFDQNSQPDANLNGQNTGLPSSTANANRGFGTYHMIRIDPGAKLPGIPAHSLNATVTWRATNDWKLGMTMIARSYSYLRGNENNQHQPGGTDQEVGRYVCDLTCSQAQVRDGRSFTLGGTAPGYVIFNLDTSLQVQKGLTVFAQITNLFNTQYFTAGRLGVDPFSPSVNGAIGPSGWNYNSTEWTNTTFLGPGAPRGLFAGVTYEFGGK
ncbi:MAG TPA: TonB-dependent receptor [Burkholderiales bacterium]|nr:TonB-dependent receptor [Burkholderiales bacterium]